MCFFAFTARHQRRILIVCSAFTYKEKDMNSSALATCLAACYEASTANAFIYQVSEKNLGMLA